MLTVLANRTYRVLFVAQVVALTGTGLLTVALGLLAYSLAGDHAGIVLGTALAIKMVAYVGVAPIVAGFASYLPRRRFLVAMDIVRAAVALTLPFINEVWHVYVLIFVLQSASAAFTPTFQATIPDILPKDADYTRALSLSRVAYDLESLLSPALAAALLSVISFHWLFAGTVVGFLVSALLVVSVSIPQPKRSRASEGIYDKTTRGIRIYLATPRLRGLLALNLSVAAAGAMVIVNTVVLVKSRLGLTDADVAMAMACFGGGSMLAALTVPRLLDRGLKDRSLMIGAAAFLAALLFAMAFCTAYDLGPLWLAILVVWALMGIGYSMVLTPTGRLLARSAHSEDRPTLYAAQFALSHACWLLTYPLAGRLGAFESVALPFFVLGLVNLAGVMAAYFLWPAEDPVALPHVHKDLPANHPHLQGNGTQHVHAYVIDDLHPRWPAVA